MDDPLGGGLRSDDPGDVTQKMSVPGSGAEKAPVVGDRAAKVIGKLGADFVACLPDHRTQRQPDPRGFRALPCHGVD